MKDLEKLNREQYLEIKEIYLNGFNYKQTNKNKQTWQLQF
jgi:hypothetical protein